MTISTLLITLAFSMAGIDLRRPALRNMIPGLDESRCICSDLVIRRLIHDMPQSLSRNIYDTGRIITLITHEFPDFLSRFDAITISSEREEITKQYQDSMVKTREFLPLLQSYWLNYSLAHEALVDLDLILTDLVPSRDQFNSPTVVGMREHFRNIMSQRICFEDFAQVRDVFWALFASLPEEKRAENLHEFKEKLANFEVIVMLTDDR